MHGIKRTRLTPQAAEAKRAKELEKIEAYVRLQQDVLALKKARDYSAEALGRTTQLLDQNPEFYTVWNYRRHIILRGLFPSSTVEERVKILSGDLKLTMAYLQVHPKVYWIWNHRKWCLENVPLGPGETEGWRNDFWKMELMVDEKMLDSDARNFHAWSYRRYILASLPSSFTPERTPQDELRYTKKKIESNFSNFSAWHCRTKVLGQLWESLSDEQVTKEKDEEFELVQQALWTDPGDQSGWLYHRWLMGTEPSESLLRRELKSINELHDTEPDMRWCMNALARYSLLLVSLPSISEAERDTLTASANKIYERLIEIDPDRKGRYEDKKIQAVE